MGKVTISQWYERVNRAWPEKVTAPTGEEAIRAAKKLYRFALGHSFSGAVMLTSGNRYTWIYRGELHVNPDRAEMAGRGWVALVHDLSHFAHRRLHPGARPHSGTHARLEIRMIKEVIKRGWLIGTLRSERVEKPSPDAKALKYARTLAAIERWEAKERRAANALKKLLRSLRAQERAQVTRGVMPAKSTIQ